MKSEKVKIINILKTKQKWKQFLDISFQNRRNECSMFDVLLFQNNHSYKSQGQKCVNYGQSLPKS